MPQGSKVEKAEARIRAEGRKKGFRGKRLDQYVYGALNNQGLMRGNRPTKKGKRKVTHSHHHRPHTTLVH